MKKTYESPKTALVNVALATMVAASSGTPRAALDTTNSSVEAGSIEARGGLWDDDED